MGVDYEACFGDGCPITENDLGDVMDERLYSMKALYFSTQEITYQETILSSVRQ